MEFWTKSQTHTYIYTNTRTHTNKNVQSENMTSLICSYQLFNKQQTSVFAHIDHGKRRKDGGIIHANESGKWTPWKGWTADKIKIGCMIQCGGKRIFHANRKKNEKICEIEADKTSDPHGSKCLSKALKMGDFKYRRRFSFFNVMVPKLWVSGCIHLNYILFFSFYTINSFPPLKVEKMMVKKKN